jgi:hypothetical protein
MTHEYQASDVIYPYEIKNNRLIYRTINSKLPFNVPIVIIDTYTPPELYQNIFNRKVITLDILSLFPALNKTPENLKIYQYDGGYLPKKSLYFQQVRDWLFPTIADYLQLKPKTIHAIYIANYYMQILRAHLAKHNIKNFKMYHFYDAISKGSESLDHVNNMIIVGTPEPNEDKLKSQIEMFYIGKQQLDMTYNKTAHTYNDKRVQVFYAIQNSEHIRTLIYKMRPLTSKSKKTILLLSKILLKENTERLSIQDLQFRIKNADMSMSREKVLLSISHDGEVIAKRIDKVIGNYFNKHSTQDQVQMSTIIRNVKSKNEFKTYDDSVISDIIKLICIIDGRSIRK